MIIISLKMGVPSLGQQSNHGIMDEQVHQANLELDSVIPSPSSSSSSDVSSVASSESELMEEVTSSTSSLSSSPLQSMSSLLQQLPFKRGLSKHYQGKSQSFTSLSNVRCLEDLAKPENPYNKKLKSCKSYGGLLSDAHLKKKKKSSSSSSSNRPCCSNVKSSSISSRAMISKKTSALSRGRGSCSSLGSKRATTPSYLGNRPSMPPPHRSTGTNGITSSRNTPLLA